MGNIFQKFAKVLFAANATKDILKEKAESKATELFMQLKNCTNKNTKTKEKQENTKTYDNKVLDELINEIHHRAQISELQLKSFIKDKLTEFTNNALLDSMELNDIRAEIATLRAELKDLKEEMQLQKSKK